jgi:hypothetical protein
VSRRLVSLTLDNFGELNTSCRSCLHWELEPEPARRACAGGSADLEKEAWISDTLLQWGSCGQILYVDSIAAGHVLYAPPAYVPRSIAFPTSPVSADAVLLMTGQLLASYRGAGLGRMLIQGVARDIARRGLKAIEAFGATNPGGMLHRDHPCLLPAEFLHAVGFKTVRPHPTTPRMRLDIRATLTWREDVEVAIDRLFSTIGVPSLARYSTRS